MGSSRSRSKCPAKNEDRLTMRGTYRFVIAFPGSGKRRRDKLLVHVCWGIVHTQIYSYFWSICIFIFESQLTGLELQSYPKFIVVALSHPLSEQPEGTLHAPQLTQRDSFSKRSTHPLSCQPTAVQLPLSVRQLVGIYPKFWSENNSTLHYPTPDLLPRSRLKWGGGAFCGNLHIIKSETAGPDRRGYYSESQWINCRLCFLDCVRLA